mgnify:CR=1 FL=1
MYFDDAVRCYEVLTLIQDSYGNDVFDGLIFQKAKGKNWQISAQESKKWSNNKIKALYFLQYIKYPI